MATVTSQKRLALAIIDFLSTSLTDGTVSSEDSESIEIASNCIAEAFKVDPTDTAATADALGGQNLLAVYSVYEKLKGKSTPSTKGESSAQEARPATPATGAPSTPAAGGKDEAEKLKAQGNAAMQKKDYASAIDFYTKALEIVPLNPIYLSNRAAAYSGALKHEEAQQDAEMAVAADPKYSKAWSRLGLARFALGDAKGSMEAYKQGMEAEGGGSDVMRRGYETAKKRYEEEAGDVGAPDASTRSAPSAGAGGMPDLSSLASMFGGGGGGGGMPDLSQMMNNPMVRQMAQQVMQNPDMLNSMMNDPRVAQMAERFGGGRGDGQGGGVPDLSSLMNDPSIADMAKNFMGGGRGTPPQ
ncbi:small glutamine-rich tetratricopeptide repeat-containing protein-like protein [Cenococcum geophilum]